MMNVRLCTETAWRENYVYSKASTVNDSHHHTLAVLLLRKHIFYPVCQRPNSRRYQIFWEAVGLERGPLSLLSTTEELLGKKSSGSGIENREYGRRDPSRWPRGSFYPLNLTLTSPTSGGLSVAIVRSRTQATEFLSVRGWMSQTNKQTNKLHGLSPRAIYTDRATAACQRSDCQL
jgi:hypothetical protein